MIFPIKLPPPKNFSNTPIWNGEGFNIGKVFTPVLEYSEDLVGWSSSLTSLHEEVAGVNHPIDVASRKDAIKQIKKLNLKKNSIIMEIGCSSGFMLKALRNNFPDCIIIGADVLKEPLYQIAKVQKNIPLIKFDLVKSPIPDNSIDTLILLNVLEHIKDDFKALKKAFNMLKPNGSIVIEVPAGPMLYDSYDKELNHFRRYTAKELKDKLNRAGFTVKRLSHLGFFLFPLFALVKLKNKIFARQKIDVVRENISSTSKNIIIKSLMRLEQKYFSNASFKFGIRVLTVAKK